MKVHSQPRRFTVAAIAAGIVVISALGMRPPQDPDAKPSRVSPSDPPRPTRSVRGLAKLEPANGLITIGARPGARIRSIQVAEGDHVRAGQPLFVLEGGEAARHQINALEAKKKAMLATRDRQRRQAALENEKTDAVQKVRIDMAEKSYRALEAQVKRLTDVTKSLPPTTSLTDRVGIESSLEQVRVQQYPAYLALEQAKIDQGLLERQRTLTNEALADGGPEDAALDAEIEAARAGHAEATVTAPSDGDILLLLAHPGEISSGPVLFLGDRSKMRAVAEIDENDIGQVAVGDPAEVRIVDQRATGRVARVGAMVAPNLMAAIDPRSRQDTRVIRVVIDLDESAAAAPFVNMQVEVAINPQLDGAPAVAPEPTR